MLFHLCPLRLDKIRSSFVGDFDNFRKNLKFAM